MKKERKSPRAASAISSDQMYRIEENGHSAIGMRRFLMMENAGHGLSDFLVARFKGRLQNKSIVAVCGTGNNGGDGFVAARHLSGYGARLTVVLLGSPSQIKSEEARLNWGIIEKMDDSVEIIFGEEVSDEVRERIARADVVIDAIFGTGIRGEIREPYASAIDAINGIGRRNDDDSKNASSPGKKRKNKKKKKRAFTLAVDVPSGLDPNTGEVHGSRCVSADATVTFHRLKTGLKKKSSRKYTGPVHVEWIGIPPEAERGVL